jgi:hypothetical protein
MVDSVFFLVVFEAVLRIPSSLFLEVWFFLGVV